MLAISVHSVFKVQAGVCRSLFHVQRPRPLAVCPEGLTSWKRCVSCVGLVPTREALAASLAVWLYDNRVRMIRQPHIFQENLYF